METVDKVMNTYTMMVNLTTDQERVARKRVSEFLKGKDKDADKLTVQALKFWCRRRVGRN
jgi:hypothetical protein